MNILFLYAKRYSAGLTWVWMGLGSVSFAAIPDNNMIDFGIYSVNSIPMQISGSARLKEGNIKLPAVPSYIKQAILSSKTTNPFKSVYGSIYTSTFLKQLQSCPFVGMPYELDGNAATQEWVVMTVFYGCIEGYNSLVSGQPHNWILSQNIKKQFQILIESDGGSLSVTKSQAKQKNYDKLVTRHYVVNFAPTARPQCGGAYVKWQYRQNRYQITDQTILPDGCENLFEYGESFEIFSQSARNDNEKKAQKAVKAVVTPWLKQLRAVR